MEVVGGGSSTGGPGGGDCSSCSGTLASTYTPGCSPLSSSSCSFHPPGVLSVLELDVEARAKKLGHIKRLVEEFQFLRDDAAADGNGNVAGGKAVERWFSEMDIAWVLRLGVGDGDGDGDASAGAGSILASHSLPHLARCWILGLREVKDSTFIYMEGLCNEEDAAESMIESEPPPPLPAAAALSEFSRFVQSTLLKMLPFVDAIAAPSCSEQHGGTVSLQSLPETTTTTTTRLQALVDVRDALSTASEEIQFWPCYSSSLYHVQSAAAVGMMIDEIRDLLSSKLGKLDKAIWDTMDEIRTGLMKAGTGTGTGNDDSASASASASASSGLSSADVHELTRSVISCINLLDTNYVLLSRIADEAAQLGSYLPETLGIAPLTSLIMEMFSRLEEKLISMSQSSFQFQFQFPFLFPFQSQSQCDSSLGILFLINNSHFIWQQLHPMFDMAFPMAVLNRKIDDYIQSYLHLSWGPVLSCLHHDPGPLRRGRYYSSALTQFEFEFHKVYRAQRFWKVPDPELRGKLRRAIANKVTSGLKKFLDDKKVTTPRITPQELVDMLQELFEG